MKANELRIGNWVNRTDSLMGNIIGHVKFDETDWYAIGECIDFLENYDPIPLTEEWLVKFGAIDVNKEDRDKYNFKEINWFLGFVKTWGDFRIYQMPSEFRFYLSEHKNFDIKYVHQLQNLYFCLTGEELEIKKG